MLNLFSLKRTSKMQSMIFHMILKLLPLTIFGKVSLGNQTIFIGPFFFLRAYIIIDGSIKNDGMWPSPKSIASAEFSYPSKLFVAVILLKPDTKTMVASSNLNKCKQSISVNIIINIKLVLTRFKIYTKRGYNTIIFYL